MLLGDQAIHVLHKHTHLPDRELTQSREQTEEKKSEEDKATLWVRGVAIKDIHTAVTEQEKN